MNRSFNLPQPVVMTLGYMMSCVLPWGVAVVALLLALASGNLFPVIACAVGGIWFLVAVKSDWGIEQFGLKGPEYYARDNYFRGRLDFWFVVGMPLCAAYLSQCIFLPWGFHAYSVLDHEGKVTYHNNYHLSLVNPMTVKIRYFSSDYSTTVACLGKTADGRGIRAEVSVTLSLPFSGLPDAHAQAEENLGLRGLARTELCSRFASVLSRYTVDSLPSRLSLESRTADERLGMNRLGLLYSGTIYVEKMTAYVVQ